MPCGSGMMPPREGPPGCKGVYCRGGRGAVEWAQPGVEVPRGPEPSVKPGAISRRQFVVGTGAAGLGLLAGCGRLPWQAEPPPAKVSRVGVLIPGSAQSGTASLEALRQGLRDLGQLEGHSIVLEVRYGE